MASEFFNPSFDWIAGETKIVISDIDQDESRLKILDRNLNEEKAIAIPDSKVLNATFPVRSAGRDILVRDFMKGRVWAFDTEAGRWRKIY